MAVAASYAAGLPLEWRSGAELPPPALGWSLLLHLERAAALLSVLGATLLIGWHTAILRLPTRLGPVEYPAEETAEALEELKKRVGALEERERRMTDGRP